MGDLLGVVRLVCVLLGVVRRRPYLTGRAELLTPRLRWCGHAAPLSIPLRCPDLPNPLDLPTRYWIHTLTDLIPGAGYSLAFVEKDKASTNLVSSPPTAVEASRMLVVLDVPTLGHPVENHV
jgi:hypothetical protein